MEQYISKSALLAKIDWLVNNYDKALDYEAAIEDVRNFLDTLEVIEVDLDDEIIKWEEFFGHCPASMGYKETAKHFFELGMRVNNPITAADRGTAEEIIISLKQVEKDYHINHTKEIEWLRNKVKKGEEPQVKESAEIQHVNDMCKENGNSLTQEPASNVWHDMSEDAENGRNTIIIDPKGFYGAVLRKGGSQLRNHNKERYVKWAYIDDIINITKKEEPVNDELEKAAVEAFKQIVDSDKNNFLEIFKAGAKWQAEQFEKNRLSACDRQAEEEAEIERYFVMGIIENEHRQPTFDDAIKYGMRLQKEQMIAKAVDGVVTFDYYGGDKAYGCVAHDSFCLEDCGLKDRDEVKILILKK